jgi:regulator of sigma E protease
LLLITILAFLFVLGVLIFVHELGHFLAARRHGVRVLTFSLGFGPKILKVTRGDTEYCISAVPLGGYVKMAGENPEDPRSGQPDEFLSKTKWQRFQILFAGPAMNILLAVVVTAFVLGIQGVRQPVYFDEPALIGSVVSGSPAEKAGLRRGDRVITVSGDQIATWKDLELAIGLRRPNRDISVTVLRDSQNVTMDVRPVAEGKYEVSDIGVMPDANPIITRVLSGDRAEKAGLKAGDIILAVNGERMATRMQLIDVISHSGGKTIQAHGPSRWQRPGRHRDTGTARCARLARRRTVGANQVIHAGALRSHPPERRAQHRVVGDHLQNTGRAVHRRNIGAAAAGPGGDRDALR